MRVHVLTLTFQLTELATFKAAVRRESQSCSQSTSERERRLSCGRRSSTTSFKRQDSYKRQGSFRRLPLDRRQASRQSLEGRETRPRSLQRGLSALRLISNTVLCTCTCIYLCGAHICICDCVRRNQLYVGGSDFEIWAKTVKMVSLRFFLLEACSSHHCTIFLPLF